MVSVVRIWVFMATQGWFWETYTVWLFWVDYNFVALGILSTSWWFLYPRPISNQKKIFQTQNGSSPVRTVCSALDCVHRVYRVPSMTWSQSDSVGEYTLGSSLWPMLGSLWMGVSLCEYLILFVMCVCVHVLGRRPAMVKAHEARIPPRSEGW